jgi:sugar lactone lactonase YvrE
MSKASTTGVQIVSRGLALGESPRWHDGRLWVCDWGAQEIVTVGLDGGREVVLPVPTLPFSIDWLPDGHLLIVSGGERRVLRREPDGSLVTHADLSDVTEHAWNEIVVDARGTAFVDNIGFDFPEGEFAPGFVAVVAPDGSARVVADDLAFPNGMALTPGDSTLIVAESYAGRLTAFDVDADGSLSNRRVWADLGEGAAPDGICLDADGCVWYADVPNRRCVRVAEGGAVLAGIELDRGCFSCALGGEDGRTLFMVAAEWPSAMAGGAPTGRVLTARAPAPSAT